MADQNRRYPHGIPVEIRSVALGGYAVSINVTKCQVGAGEVVGFDFSLADALQNAGQLLSHSGITPDIVQGILQSPRPSHPTNSSRYQQQRRYRQHQYQEHYCQEMYSQYYEPHNVLENPSSPPAYYEPPPAYSEAPPPYSEATSAGGKEPIASAKQLPTYAVQKPVLSEPPPAYAAVPPEYSASAPAYVESPSANTRASSAYAGPAAARGKAVLAYGYPPCYHYKYTDGCKYCLKWTWS